MQGDLFSGGVPATSAAPDLPLDVELLRRWQYRLHQHQAPLFQGEPVGAQQPDLFTANPADPAATINPTSFTPLPLSFWRWPDSPHRGAAIYFVLDRPPELEQPLLLYVGETLEADKRWKGEHDCKAYLSAYGEALQRCALPHQLSIRFCTDVPAATRPRRALEQALIQRWLPPFNKETRQRWTTPFTADT